MANSNAIVPPNQQISPIWENSQIKANVIVLDFGGGGGGRVDAETKNYVDKSMDVVRAENDKRFSGIESKFAMLSDKIDSLPRPVPFWQLAGMAASALIIGFTLLGVFADRFDGGISAYGTFDKFFEKQQKIDETQNERLNKIISTMEAINTKIQNSHK